MKKTDKRTLKESQSLNIEKDPKQFPDSQFSKDQRQDAEKAEKTSEKDRTTGKQ